MKATVETRPASGALDHLALGVATFGVGYIPGAPGTYGSAVGISVYLGTAWIIASCFGPGNQAWANALVGVSLLVFSILGIWAAGRSTSLLGSLDPPQAVVDEVIGQIIVFLFVPFGVSWPILVAGFLLFRLFDIWKPYPIDSLQELPGGIGVCADDILAGVYAGVCLSIVYAISLSL